MSGMTSGALARLAFWARGMTAIQDGRMEWPGFSYTDVEWARMRDHDAEVDHSFGKEQETVQHCRRSDLSFSKSRKASDRSCFDAEGLTGVQRALWPAGNLTCGVHLA